LAQEMVASRVCVCVCVCVCVWKVGGGVGGVCVAVTPPTVGRHRQA
jgi:hypothetical protein